MLSTTANGDGSTIGSNFHSASAAQRPRNERASEERQGDPGDRPAADPAHGPADVEGRAAQRFRGRAHPG